MLYTQSDAFLLIRSSVAGSLGRLCVVLTCPHGDTVIRRVSTSEVKGAELPAIGPESATLSSAGVTISKPLALAVLTLPIAHLHLPIGTRAGSGDLERPDIAVSVDTYAAVDVNRDVIVDVSIAVSAVTSLELECRV
jgi:hypothetical protein